MEIIISCVANLALAGSILFYRRLARLKWLQLDPCSYFLFIALLPTIVGINVFLFSDIEIPWGLHDLLNPEIILPVYIGYYLSWCLTFIFFGIAQSVIRIKDRRISHNIFLYDRSKEWFSRLVLISLCLILLIDLYLIGDLPGFYIFNGDVIGAEMAKGRFIEERFKSSIPILGYLMQYFPLFALAWMFDEYYSSGKRLKLLIAVLLLVIYSVMTLIKSFVLMPVIVAMAVFISYSEHRINLKFVGYSICLVFAVIIIPFYLIFNEQEINLLAKVGSRIFLVQIQGAMLIRSIFEGWDLTALLYGAPLLKRLGFVTMDPAAQVFIEAWGEQGGNGFVNMNSHYIGQGFVMFGDAIPVIGPLIILMNFAAIVLASRTFQIGKSSHISGVIALTAMSLIPFNNNFGNAVYFKPLLAFLILTIFIFILYRFSRLITR